jgi:tripartite-type tricarboxylate transporter receptor subunit TctC
LFRTAKSGLLCFGKPRNEGGRTRVGIPRTVAAVAALFCVLASFAASAADDYPFRPITLTHGFGAGGNADAIARIVADGLSRRLGKPVIVEARPGAGGNIASDRAAKAAPDGYTLIMLTGGHAVSAAMYKALPFDPVEDFQMISTVVFFPFVVAVKSSHRFQTPADLIAEAKAKPDTLTYSSVGVGSTQHLVGELLSSMVGVRMIHVPYKGGGGPINDLLGGQIDILIDTLTITAPQLTAGTIRGLGVTSQAPWFSIPDVPPIADVVPGYEVRSWLGIATSKNVPQPVIDKLNRELRAVLEMPDTKSKLQAMGNEVRSGSPDDMRNMIVSEISRWKRVIETAGIPRQ